MDNFDLKKFLKENKVLENLNPTIKSLNEGEAAYEYEKGKEAGKREEIKAKIKEMIVAELELDLDNPGKDSDAGLYDPVYESEEVEEAKKKDKEEEDVEDVEITDTEEEMPVDDEMSAEEAPTGGLEDIAADMKGTEGDLMDHLMKAFQISKGMGNEKLETQVGNTLKFFVSEYIGGGED